MARKPPARVRAGLSRMPRPYHRSPRRVVPGVSAPTQRLIAEFELARASPGAVALALETWSATVRSQRVHEPGPPVPVGWPCCAVDCGRRLLEQALRALPARAARELRSVVRPVDEVFLARVRPDPAQRKDFWTDGL